MKKTAAILFLFVLAFNLAGVYVVFNVQRYQFRKEMKQLIRSSIPDHELSAIRITRENQSALEWKHAKEFRYKGEMYDIVRTVYEDNGTVTYYCIADKKETRLFAALESHLHKQTGNDGPSTAAHHLMKLIAGKYLPVNTLSFFTGGVASVLFPAFTPACSHHGAKTASPPPKIG